MQKRLFIIAGCNGAGKTTASFRILPELLNCREFVNADEIARGISPFQPEKVALEAGRIMLSRMQELIEKGEDFAFETTLATKSYLGFIEKAHQKGYFVSLVFFWLQSPALAIERVKTRVREGGHSIPKEVVIRRYSRGIQNLFKLFSQKVDYLAIFDNSNTTPELIAEEKNGLRIFHQEKFNLLKSLSYE
ncbi:Predicted ABC-type ATPase [Algoriphagus alkaliphilus]|uniref:Predicted ABC-type ATPase n=1 Tax=Algoriphagus alkaliphilus TaxID=279824 RepID=A0A1G5YB35_9BACT|nr:zeta toxin family protein [Algoriphagus alkaliphilus]SDA79848.1 Predicted ABC-type ATPase [Algoriphagus alkaliphilus]